MQMNLSRYRTVSQEKYSGMRNNKPRYDWGKKIKRRKGWKV